MKHLKNILSVKNYVVSQHPFINCELIIQHNTQE